MALITSNFAGNPGAIVIDAAFNPDNPEQAYILWSDSKISYKGNPPSLEASRPKLESSGQFNARRIQIQNWTTGAGHIMLTTGRIYRFNGAVDPGSSFPAPPSGGYWSDFSMKPDDSGQGYRMANNGSILQFGGAPAPVSPLYNLNPPFAHRIWVDWDDPSDNWLILHGSGHRFPAPGADIHGPIGTPGTRGPFYPGENICRDFFVFDTDDHWRGYILNGRGGIDPFWMTDEPQPADIATNQPFNFPNENRARVLAPLVIDSGNVTRAAMITLEGTVYDWTVTPQDYSVSVSAPSGAQTTRKPTVQYTSALEGNGQNPDRTEIRVFRSDQYNDEGFTISWIPMYGSGVINKFATFGVLQSFVLTSNLGNGTFKAYVRVGKVLNDGTTIDWSTWDDGPEFTLTGTPPAPTNVTPAAGSTVNTDVPVLGMTLVAEEKGARLLGQWELAQNSGFTAGVRGALEGLLDLRASGVTTEPLLTGAQLSQGIWYLRGRAVTEFGDTSPWTAAQQITVSHPPSTSGHTPTGNQARPYGDTGTVELDWNFSDSSPVDSQTAYQIVIERNDTGAAVLDSGKVLSVDSVASATIPSQFMNVELRWRVRVWDSDDVVGPYSANNIFRVMELADVEITSPVGSVTTPMPTVEWTFAATADRVAAAFRVRIIHVETEEVVFDSGQRQGAATEVTVDEPVLTNTEVYEVEVTVWDSNGLSSTDNEVVTASWIPPDAGAEVVIDTQFYEEDGYILISWNDDTLDEDFSEWRIYSRVPGEGNVWVLVDSTLASPYQDPRAPTNVEIEYAVVQVAIRFEVPIESARVPYSAFTTGTHYWIVDLDDLSLSTKLEHVTADDLEDEVERATIPLIGRGRKVDKGTVLGVSGTLKAEIRDTQDGTTARQHRRKLDAIKNRSSGRVYLRNPFGDVWAVSLEDMQVSRLAGVGTHEYCNVSIPYQEVV